MAQTLPHLMSDCLMLKIFKYLLCVCLFQSITPSAFAQSLADRGIAPSELASHLARTVARNLNEAELSVIITSGKSKGKYGYLIRTNSFQETLILQTAPRKDSGTQFLAQASQILKYSNGRKELPAPFTNLDDFWLDSPILGTELAYGLFISPFPQCTLLSEKDDIYRLSCQDVRQSPIISWNKVIVDVDAPRLLPLKASFIDENNTVTRTITFTDFKKLAGRTSAGTIIYDNPKRRKDRVIVKINALNPNDSYFSKRFEFLED